MNSSNDIDHAKPNSQRKIRGKSKNVYHLILTSIYMRMHIRKCIYKCARVCVRL
jgi:hypothetical protein